MVLVKFLKQLTSKILYQCKENKSNTNIKSLYVVQARLPWAKKNGTFSA